ALALDGITEVDVDRLRLVDGTIDPAVVAGYQPALARIARGATRLRAAAARLDSPWLAAPLQDQVARFRRSTARAADSARTATQAAAVAPWLLGGEGRRTYLVAFVTPSEARASGGFMGNFGVLVADRGRLDLVRTGRDDELDRAGDPATKHISGPADYVARYGRFDPAHTWANLTLSPDFPAVAQAMAELFPQSGGEAVDGVIRMDPQALAGLLRLTGPVHVEGLPLELDADNVAPYLLAGQYEAFADQDVRSDLLGEVADLAFDQLTTGKAPRPAEVAAALGPAIAHGNLALWFRDARAQAFVVRIGADDALPPPDDSDRFGVTTQNASGNKIEAFLQRTVRYHVDLDTRTGRTATTVEVELHNDAPVGGFPPSVIGNLVGQPVGTNRSYLSFFSTQQVLEADLDGTALPLHRDREAGYRVASAFVDLPPGATRTVTLRLAGAMNLSGGRYRFSYLPQVMVRPDRVSWSLATDEGGRVTGADATGTEAATAAARPRRTARTVHARRWPSVGPWSTTVHVDRAADGT
ncbi:MAG: Methyl-accepting chemotaxis protein, partial [Acidimicrobiales bacterium]|nr:Methyl-accepting chemotaxis protein [Acidimicrobiales bacterium]